VDIDAARGQSPRLQEPPPAEAVARVEVLVDESDAHLSTL
jgi:hypothetical protein